jgi:hypothetical protein
MPRQKGNGVKEREGNDPEAQAVDDPLELPPDENAGIFQIAVGDRGQGDDRVDRKMEKVQFFQGVKGSQDKDVVKIIKIR